MGDGRWYADMWSEEPKNWLPNQGNSTLPFAAVLLADGTQHKVQAAAGARLRGARAERHSSRLRCAGLALWAALKRAGRELDQLLHERPV